MTRAALQSATFALLLMACNTDPTAQVTIHGSAGRLSVTVETATTPEARSRGLMWRNGLSEGRGMLFVFSDDDTRVFWMKNTPVSLDIIFISHEGRVVSVAHGARPYSNEPISSAGPARYVLEVAAGLAERYGIGGGNTVDLGPLAGLEAG